MVMIRFYEPQDTPQSSFVGSPPDVTHTRQAEALKHARSETVDELPELMSNNLTLPDVAEMPVRSPQTSFQAVQEQAPQAPQAPQAQRFRPPAPEIRFRIPGRRYGLSAVTERTRRAFLKHSNSQTSATLAPVSKDNRTPDELGNFFGGKPGTTNTDGKMWAVAAAVGLALVFVLARR